MVFLIAYRSDGIFYLKRLIGFLMRCFCYRRHGLVWVGNLAFSV